MIPCRRCGNADRYPPAPSDLAKGCRYGKCRPCQLERTGCRHRERPDIRAAEKLRQQYGLDREQAQVALVNAQGGLCDLCGALRRLEVDHAHTAPKSGNWRAYRTGTARGMLCRPCNQLAGLVERGGAVKGPGRVTVHRYLAGRGPGRPRTAPDGPGKDSPRAPRGPRIDAGRKLGPKVKPGAIVWTGVDGGGGAPREGPSTDPTGGP